MTWVYAIECAGKRLYIGIAENPAQRINAHCRGRGAVFTRLFPPKAFVVAIRMATHRAAAKLERRLKQLPHDQKAELFRTLVAEATNHRDEEIPLPGICQLDDMGHSVELKAKVVIDFDEFVVKNKE